MISVRRIVLVVAVVALLFIACFVYLSEGLDDVDAEMASVVVSELRMPRMLCALGVGTLLSVAGALMQGVFRNPLVEPYTMGISGGAVVGVAVAFVSGAVAVLGGAGVTIGAALGGLLSLALVLVMRRAAGYDTGAMLMCGIMVSFVSSAATTVILSVASREDLSQVVSWTVGSFEGVDKSMAWGVVCVAALATLLSPLAGNVLNVLALGDDEARSLGVSPSNAALTFFVIATLLAAVSVSATGVVAFVGMAVPHFVRRLFGGDYRVVLPACGLVGALALIVCDLVAKTVIYPRELPAGAVCAVLGGIMFTYLTVRWKRMS